MSVSPPTPLQCHPHLCEGHGRCMMLNGEPTCECALGYRGAFCQDRVSESIRIPLTLGVLGVLAGFILLAFIFVLVRKKRRAFKRKRTLTAKRTTMVDKDKDLPL